MFSAAAIKLLALCLLVHVAAGVHVRVHYPSSRVPAGDTLYLRGSGHGLSWSEGLALARPGNRGNTWSTTLAVPPGETVEFKATLGRTGPLQKGASVVIHAVSEGDSDNSVDVYPWFLREHGSWRYVGTVHSDEFDNDRGVVEYLPPSYAENTEKRIEHVLIMHDGQNLFDPATSFSQPWMIQDTLDREISAGTMQEIIVVGLYNTPGRMEEYTYSKDSEYGGGRGDEYVHFLIHTVKPWIRQRYRISDGDQVFGTLGSSLGGLISCYAGWVYPEQWGTIGCMSSSFWWNDQDFDHDIVPRGAVPDHLVIYMDSGDAGPSHDSMEATLQVRKDMEQRGFPDQRLWYYLDHGASHNEYYWGRRFHVPMTHLYAPRAYLA